MTDFTKIDAEFDEISLCDCTRICYGHDELSRKIKSFLHSKLEEAVRDYITWAYGKRCKDYQEGCACCDQWKLYDDYIFTKEETK